MQHRLQGADPTFTGGLCRCNCRRQSSGQSGIAHRHCLQQTGVDLDRLFVVAPSEAGEVMLKNFADIEKLARERATDPLLIACVEPHEPKLIQAIDRAMKNRLIKPVLIGDETAILNASKEAGVETRGWELVRSPEPNHSVYKALELIHDNKVGGICKGVFGVRISCRSCLNADSDSACSGIWFPDHGLQE